MSPSTHRIPVERLAWLPSTWNRFISSHADALPTLEEASEQEKAIALYRKTSGDSSTTTSDRIFGQRVVVEWRESFGSEDTHVQYARRLDYLVAVLRKLSASVSQSFSAAHTEGDFKILHCLGWTSTKDYDRVGLVFSVPQTPASSSLARSLIQTPDILTLNDWLARTRRDKSMEPPPLGLRFDIARGLVLALGNLISVGWIHKELRSHNVLFFGKYHSGSPLSKPYLSGYTYARPTHEMPRDVSSLVASPEYALYRPTKDVLANFQTRMASIDATGDNDAVNGASSDDSGEEKLSTDKMPIKTDTAWRTSALDIYGLGIVLLEIGLWRTIQSLQSRSMSQEHFVKYELDGIVQSLSYRTGDLYCGVVRQSLNFGNWAENRAQETEFFGRVIEDLALCSA